MHIKHVLRIVLLMLLPATVYCARINWVTAGKPSTIPNDGNVYFVSGSQTNNSSLDIQGNFEISAGADLTSNAAITVNGGTLTIVYDALSVLNNLDNQSNFTLNSGSVFVNDTFYNGLGSTVTINGGTFKIGNTSESGSLQADTINVNGGSLHVDNGTITLGFSGVQRGHLNVNSGSFIMNNGTIKADALSVPFSTFTLFSYPYPNSGVNFVVNGAMNITNDPTTMVIPAGSSLIIKPNATVQNDQDITNNGTIAIEGSFTHNTAEPLINNGTIILINGGSFTNNGTYNENGVFLDFNNENNFVIPLGKTGTFPLGLPIDIEPHQTLNVAGNLLNLSPETLNVNGSTYIYGSLYNGDASNPGTINVNPKGKLYLLSGRLRNDHANSVINVNPLGSLYNYHGLIDLNAGGSNSLNVSHGGKLHNMSSSDPGIFTIPNGGNYLQNTQVSLEKSLEVDYTWTITEQVTIKGNANTITFGPEGQIRIVGPNASLLLDDIILENVSGTKIRCTDANTTLSLHNVIWTQDTNFDFTWGKINVTGEWLIEGKDTAFNFESTHGLKIEQDSTIHFKQTTLNYNINTNNLIQMVDESSQINLERARILATQSCTLTNGTLLTTGRGTLQGTGTLDVQGMSLAILGSLHHIGDVVL